MQSLRNWSKKSYESKQVAEVKKGGVKMAKAILVYGSTTGNTETLSKSVIEGLKKGGVEVTLKNVTETDVNELKDYDLIVFGSSSWGVGGESRIEMLQEDFRDFYDRMGSISLKGKNAAVFGPGYNSMYGEDEFCKAVDYLEKQLERCGAKIVTESLKIDGEVEPAMKDAENWGLKVAQSLQ
jgi:flavodoxin I